MTQDTGQNQVVIDWLVNGDPDRTFLSTPERSITYAELRAAMSHRQEPNTATLMPSLDINSVLGIFSAVASGPVTIGRQPGRDAYVLPDEVMTVLSTSGTTGSPKLVPLTTGNWHAAVEASALHLGHDDADNWLVAMPLHHVGGLSVLFRSAYVGGEVTLLPGFEPAQFADALASGATMASVVPTMLKGVLDHDSRSYQGLKAVLVGGGPIPHGLLERASDRGLPVLPTYGMTETCAQVATLKPGSPLAHKAHLLPGVEARVESDGRIALRGAQIFPGYLGEAPRPAGEWFITGDIGEILDDGALKVLGRADEVIVTGGENVDPAQVESVVRSLSGVDGCMVVGIPSDQWGSEVVCLFAGPAEVSTLDHHARDSLQPFQVPKRWIRLESLPMTDSGKPDRNRGRTIASGH